MRRRQLAAASSAAGPSRDSLQSARSGLGQDSCASGDALPYGPSDPAPQPPTRAAGREVRSQVQQRPLLFDLYLPNAQFDQPELELAERLAEAVKEGTHQIAHRTPLTSPDQDVRMHAAKELQVTMALQFMG